MSEDEENGKSAKKGVLTMRLIDAGRAVFIATESAYLTEEDMDSFAYIINSTPTVDAVPVVHGRWKIVDWVEPDGHSFECIRTHKAGMKCSLCACAFKRELLWCDNYCPNCGAKMDGEDEEQENK